MRKEPGVKSLLFFLGKRDDPPVSNITSHQHLSKRTDASELNPIYNITLHTLMVFQPLVLALMLNIGPFSPCLSYLKGDHFSQCQCKGTWHSSCSEGCVPWEECDISERLSGPTEVLRLFRWLCCRELYINLKYGKYLQ